MKKLNIGDLVRHRPDTSNPIQKVLNNIVSDKIDPDFNFGMVIETRSRMVRVFSYQLNNVHWYYQAELEEIPKEKNKSD